MQRDYCHGHRVARYTKTKRIWRILWLEIVINMLTAATGYANARRAECIKRKCFEKPA
jgi:hypothetical protein